MRSVLWIFLYLISFSTAGICQDDEGLPPEWVFDEKEEIQKWGGMNQLAPLELDEVRDASGNERTVLKTESLGSDPYVFPDGGWNGFVDDTLHFEGAEYDTIYIGVKVNKTDMWQIFFVTTDDATYSDRQYKNFTVSKSDDFVDLEFKMDHPGWKDATITGIRLDPGRSPGVEAEIDYISLRGIPGKDDVAVKSEGKLAVAWGAVKR